ncbi:MAG: exosortase F system-associated protein [Bacteroidetes bacterium]|nr:exosortase F system-associated protein [Bacteroidota bacterium]
MKRTTIRIGLGAIAVGGLLLLFIFQKVNFASHFFSFTSTGAFVFNRSLRFIINDSLSILLIYAIFQERKYVIFACWVQVAGFLFLLCPYFILRIYWPEYNGPMLNFLHRVIINPTLMLLLIPALLHQKSTQKLE